MTTPRVVSYVRMSDDKQENSPERQRAAVAACAKAKGYTLQREYFDAGISGWKDERPGFKSLIADAAAGKFDLILVDDRSRLSRFDAIDDIAHRRLPAPPGRVRLESAKDGPMNWDDLGGQILTVVRAAKDNEAVKDMSYRVLGGVVEKARAGMWMGAAPLGYKIHRVTDPANPTKVTDRHLVPGDPLHVEAVRWMFAEYASGRLGRVGIANELAKRGIYSPRQKAGKPKPDTPEAVRTILMNRAYLAEFCWNAKTEGKFHRFKGGQAEKKSSKRVQRNDPSDWIVLPKRHEAIIDPDTFEAVQRRLNGNPRPSTPHADGGGFKLSRLLTCGKCGSWMYGFTEKQKQGTVKRYRCGAYNQNGKQGCDCNTVDEAAIIRVIASKLQGAILNPEYVANLWAAVRRQEEEQYDPATRVGLERKLAKLNAEIVQGETRLLKVPEDLFAGAVEALRTLKSARDGVSAELAKIGAQAKPTEVLERAVEDVTRHLWRLREVMEKGEPRDVRAVLESMIDRVELHFTARATAKTTRTKLVGGVIHLKLPEGLERVSHHPQVRYPACRTG